METVDEDLVRSDVDAEMTVLAGGDSVGLNPEAADEVENLRNSLREVVHDESIRPKMQCLMMDSSFSMVTMQGEDSGIAWETTPSRCNTPWASEAGNTPAVDLGHPAAACPATPGSHPAGKIIFVMDEELTSRRKRPKERVKSRQGQREVLGGSSEDVSGRPELVEVSRPNVKPEDADQDELSDALGDKEQQLFRLVSEGSEILNIVVPPKLASVDEEESKEMVDNLSYLEDSLVPKASLGSHDNEMLVPGEDQENPSAPPAAPGLMDPPGAPVARPPPGRGAAGNVDYFEAFSMVDAQAPGGPAVVPGGHPEPEVEAAFENQAAQSPEQTSVSGDADKSDTISLVEITGELLDEVFYGGTENYLPKSLDTAAGGGAEKSLPLRLPSKPSGSTLFGSQEDILTPIYLPEGPPKIIDPILLEEPKAMAFHYTDLYEEALGSRKKEEDAESVTSEKSFHSRQSDREARGYLEKYVLIDETPVVDLDPADEDKQPVEGPRILTQDLYDFVIDPELSELPNSEEEITDFFRSSGNSSPCDIDPFPRSLEEDETQKPTKTKAKTQKKVSVEVPETAVDPHSVSNFEVLSDEPDWEMTDDHPMAMDNKEAPNDTMKSDTRSPVAPPRRRAASSRKESLDLTPLTPADVAQEQEEEAGAKEQREEEKETASPAETADEGDEDGEETTLTSSVMEDVLAEASYVDIVQDADEVTETEGGGGEKFETAGGQTETVKTDAPSGESDKTERGGQSSEEPAQNKGQCVIL